MFWGTMPLKLLVPFPPEFTSVNVLFPICAVPNPQTPSITSSATPPGDLIAIAMLFRFEKFMLVKVTVIELTVPAKPVTLIVDVEEIPAVELTLEIAVPLPELNVDCAEAPPPSASMKPIVLKTDVVVRRVTNIPPSGATSVIVPK